MRLRYYSFVDRCHKRAVDAVVVVVVVWVTVLNVHNAHMHNKWNPVREQTEVVRDQRNDDDADGWMALGSDSGGWMDRWVWGYREEQENEGKEKGIDRMKNNYNVRPICSHTRTTSLCESNRQAVYDRSGKARENWFFTFEANSLKWAAQWWTRTQVGVTRGITLAHKQYTIA